MNADELSVELGHVEIELDRWYGYSNRSTDDCFYNEETGRLIFTSKEIAVKILDLENEKKELTIALRLEQNNKLQKYWSKFLDAVATENDDDAAHWEAKYCAMMARLECIYRQQYVA
jgi:hypothetical protein